MSTLTLNQRAVMAALKYDCPGDMIVDTIKTLANQLDAHVKTHDRGNYIVTLQNGLKIMVQSCTTRIDVRINHGAVSNKFPRSHSEWRTDNDYEAVLKKLGPKFREKLTHVLSTAKPFHWDGND